MVAPAAASVITDLQPDTGPAAAEPWGGPVYSHRGAEIRRNNGDHVCALLMEGHPLNGVTFGVAGTVTPLVDLWVEEGRLANYMRAVPKSGRT